jgi:ABC-2 type transport system permease protein
VDGTDSNTATVALDYAGKIVMKYANEFGSDLSVQRAKIQVNTRAWYNPDLKSRNYNVPGVIAFVIMLVCLLLTSMAVVREREIGTMEQLMVTPLRPIELMLGKTIPFAIIGFSMSSCHLSLCSGLIYRSGPLQLMPLATGFISCLYWE